MNKKAVTTIQVIVGVVGLTYVIAPDLLVGPFDDAAVAGIAGITEIVLAIIRGRIPPTTIPSNGPDDPNDPKDISDMI